MRRATVVSIGFARRFAVILLAAFCVFAAAGAIAETTPIAPARSDAHLDGLSRVDLKNLLERLKRIDKFDRASIDCFKAFRSTWARGGKKLNAGQKLTKSERNAIKASFPGDMRSWVNGCLKLKGWKKPDAAGSTNHFGEVEIPKAKVNSTPGFQTAWVTENYRITVVHEASHFRDYKKVAKASGLDFDKLRKWGKLEKKIEKFLSFTHLSPARLGHALYDLKDYMRKTNSPLDSQGRASAEQARKTLTAAEIEVLIWLYKNHKNVEIYKNYTNHPDISAGDEIRAYGVEIPFVQARIALIASRLANGSVPSGAYKDSGNGASKNKRIVFQCEKNSTQGRTPCTATYDGTGDGNPARIVGSFDHKSTTLKGLWIENKSNQKCKISKYKSYYWGHIQFVFAKDVKSWKGKWSYCDAVPNNSWNGTK